ncbi:MAG: undecaprenyl-diphosphate phosphatase [Candidatus Omnitrophota bacterium]|nr:undecaprenyl-diphosphate phosphatase [Candidatus Omnitrophota bacterium]
MTLTEAVISGAVQGVTEFLPISSSGHLVLVHSFFGFTEPSIFFDICLHIATLAAVVLYFSGDIIRLIRERNYRWLLFLAVGTVPAVLAGLFFEKKIAEFFVNPGKVAFMLILTGIVLLCGQLSLMKRKTEGGGPTFITSLIVGIAQACSLLPGISRSGMTVSAGLLGGMNAEGAFRFSFLLSIPVILGATLYKVLSEDIGAVLSGNIEVYVTGMLVAFMTGILSLRLLWWVLKEKRLFIFGAYCLLAGFAGIFLLK